VFPSLPRRWPFPPEKTGSLLEIQRHRTHPVTEVLAVTAWICMVLHNRERQPPPQAESRDRPNIILSQTRDQGYVTSVGHGHPFRPNAPTSTNSRPKALLNRFSRRPPRVPRPLGVDVRPGTVQKRESPHDTRTRPGWGTRSDHDRRSGCRHRITTRHCSARHLGDDPDNVPTSNRGFDMKPSSTRARRDRQHYPESARRTCPATVTL